MIGYLRDYANAVTALAYGFAVVGLFLAFNGKIELGVASMLCTWFLDHWDGHIARKTGQMRRPGFADFGKSFDGFADFIHGVVFPASIIILIGQGSALSLIASLFLVLAGAIRLSYFEHVGLTADLRFAGVPVSYDTPLIALFLFARPFVPAHAFAPTFEIAFIILAVLHLTTAIRLPPIRGIGIPIATIGAVCAALALVYSNTR